MTTGVVTNVTPRYFGDTLSADADSLDTVLLVNDAGDFDEAPEESRYLVIGDDLTPIQYVSAVNDEAGQQSVTLAAAVGTDFESGLPVTLWDPLSEATDKRAVAYRAWIQQDSDGKPIPATIPHEMIPLAGVSTLVGASVRVDYLGGNLTVVEVYGRQPVSDGSTINPDTLPDPSIPTTPPASSPALEVTGTAEALVVVAESVEASTVIEYHVSTTEGFTPDASSLAVETRATVVVIPSLPDGSALALDTTYFLRAVAKNVAGSAAAGVEAQGMLDAERVSSIAVGEVVAGFILAGRINVGAAYLDADEGLVIPQPDGGEIRLPVDGATAARITAHLVARSLDVEDNANFRGLTQLLGTFKMSNGIPNPTVEPGVSRTWDSISSSYSDPAGKVGLSDSVSGVNWITVYTFGGLFFLAINKTTGAFLANAATGSNLSLFTASGGVVLLGGNYYVLGQDLNRGADWYVYKFNSSFAKQAEFSIGTRANPPILGSDGTDLLVAFVSNADNLLVQTWTTAGSQVGGNLNLGTPPGSATTVRAVARGNFDLGASRVFVADNTDTIYCFNASTGARVSSNDFKSAGNSKVRGLHWDGTQFRQLDNQGNVWKYDTGVKAATSTDVAYTWFDDVDPDHETMKSPTVTFARPARAKLVVDTPPAPQVDAVGSDVANQIRVYAATAGNPVRLQATLAVGVRTVELSALDTGSAVSPAANGFVGLGITPGVIESGAVDGSSNPLTKADGSGGFRAAKFAQSGNANSGTISAGVDKDVAVVFPVAFNTAPEVSCGPKNLANLNNVPDVVPVSITTTGFTARLRRTGSSSAFDFWWKADTAN